MQPLILPGGPGRNSGLWRPPGAARINWADPRAQGLIFCSAPDGAGAPIDLIGKFGPFNQAFSLTPYASQSTSLGQAINFNVSTGGVAAKSAVGLGALLAPNGRASLLCVFVPTSGFTGTFQTAFNIASSGVNSSGLGVGVAASTNQLSFKVWSSAIGTSLNYQIGNPVIALLTFSAGSGTNTATVNLFTPLGVQNFSPLNTNTNLVNQASIGNFYRQGAWGTQGINGQVLLGAVWNRVLSPSEVASVLADPFGFLIFPSDLIFQQLVGFNPFVSLAACGLGSVSGRGPLAVKTPLFATALGAGTDSAPMAPLVRLRAETFSAAQAKTNVTGSAQLAAHGEGVAMVKAKIAGKVALQTRAEGTASAQPTIRGMIPLFARALGVAVSRASAAGTAALRASGRGAVAAKTKAGGIAQLSAQALGAGLTGAWVSFGAIRRRMATFFRGQRGN